VETQRKVKKATLTSISWEKDNKVTADSNIVVEVQFNPASLKITYANKIQNADQSFGSTMQFVGRGSSTLSADLIFDVSGENASDKQDVRRMTEKIAAFIRTTQTGSGKKTQYKVSGMRFQWGTFLFDGILESMNETLELWSEDGRPLRAMVSISLQQPGIHYDFYTPRESSNQAGTQPMTPVPKGTTVQTMVDKARIQKDWKTVASGNGIENPRHLPPGTLISL
jgi:hypothetical protein